MASFRRGGRLVPHRSNGLRAGSVILQPRQTMDWHSTSSREELLLALRGELHLEIQAPRRRIRRRAFRAGACVLLPRRTVHRLVNRSRAAAHYLYITA